ncbi:hypothetical protein UFOVP447_162 [uncultured Caudovirales phage]|uniref:Uncharacterized protein n=1 Tax=uncultured Caudovirales phage TaxID=2100421 RepID=A0A6J5MEN2_9CAUD|nr:hypothetical protein UFOVP447_162 [uncultured Caudovirales phage]
MENGSVGINRFRQIVLDIQLLFWDLPLWIMEDISWKCKHRLKRFIGDDYG